MEITGSRTVVITCTNPYCAYEFPLELFNDSELSFVACPQCVEPMVIVNGARSGEINQAVLQLKRSIIFGNKPAIEKVRHLWEEARGVFAAYYPAVAPLGEEDLRTMARALRQDFDKAASIAKLFELEEALDFEVAEIGRVTTRGDRQHIELECPYCQARISQRLRVFDGIPKQYEFSCPGCEEVIKLQLQSTGDYTYGLVTDVEEPKVPALGQAARSGWWDEVLRQMREPNWQPPK